MIATGKKLPDILPNIKSIIDELTHKYSIIRRIIEELLCVCYFNDIENLIQSVISEEFHLDMQA